MVDYLKISLFLRSENLNTLSIDPLKLNNEVNAFLIYPHIIFLLCFSIKYLRISKISQTSIVLCYLNTIDMVPFLNFLL